MDQKSLTINKILKDEAAKELLINDTCTRLAEFIDLLSTAGNITPEKIYKITKAFFDSPNIGHLNLHELKFFLSECFAFRYGIIYHGFGLDVLMGWFEQYWKAREQTFENLQADLHMSHTGDEKQGREKPFTLSPIKPGGNHKNLIDYNTAGDVLNHIKNKKAE